MTTSSFEEFREFLRKCDFGSNAKRTRVPDYGGTDRNGGGRIRSELLKYGVKNYIPLDLEGGVDLRKPVPGEKFNLGVCMDLLEHVSNPFVVSANISNSMKSGAMLFVTAPFSWPLHGDTYGDYWRFTVEGLRELFVTQNMKQRELYVIKDSIVPPKLPKAYEAVTPPAPWMRVIGIFERL